MARSTPVWSRSVALTTTPVVVFLPEGWREVKLWVDALAYAQLGTTYVAPAVTDVSGITTISNSGSPSAGTFKLTVFPNDTETAETGTIAFDASAATIKTALTTTAKFAAGDITAGGGALPTAVTLTWTGVYAVTVPKIIASSVSLTGGGVLVRTTTQPLAHGGYGYVEANTQEVWVGDSYGDTDAFLYVATVASTGTAHITCYA
jgi:hypothetical protein